MKPYTETTRFSFSSTRMLLAGLAMGAVLIVRPQTGRRQEVQGHG